MTLTQEQIIQIRQKAGLSPLPQQASVIPTEQSKRNENFVGKYDYLKKSTREEPQKESFISKIGDMFNKRAGNLREAFNRESKGEQNVLDTTRTAMGETSGFVFGDLFSPLLKSIDDNTPEIIKNIPRILTPDFIEKPVDKVVSDAFKWHDDLKKSDPKKAQAINDTLNILGVLMLAKGSGALADTATNSIKNKVGSIIDETGSAFKEVAPAISRAKSAATDLISPINDAVKTELTSNTPDLLTKFTSYVDQGKKAIANNREITPMDLAGKKAGEALKKLDEMKNVSGTKKEIYTKSVGDKIVPNVGTIAREDLMTGLKELGVDYRKNGTMLNVEGDFPNVQPVDIKLIKQVDTTLKSLGNKPSLLAVDHAIDYLQGLVYNRNSVINMPKIATQVEGIVQGAIGKLNTLAKNIGGKEYSAVQNEWWKINSTKLQLEKALGIKGNKGAALMKQLFSPNGNVSRQLFDEIKNLTGIDLVHESTLAKFVMESLGDTRQASLLEEAIKGNIPTTTAGAVKKVIDYGLNKISDPIKRAEKIIKNGK